MIVEQELGFQSANNLADPHFAVLLDYLHRSFSIANYARERFHVIYLDRQRRYLDDCVLANGSSMHLPIRMRELFTRALKLNASFIVAAHNHPSGDCRPSSHDIQATERLRDIGQALDIELLDHLIFTREKAYSMRAGGKL